MLGFLNVGPGEILVILVIALVVLGPSRLPATARTLGRFLAKTRDVVARFQQEMQAAADVPLEAIARERARLTEPLRPPTPAAGEPDETRGPALAAGESDEPPPDEAPRDDAGTDETADTPQAESETAPRESR